MGIALIAIMTAAFIVINNVAAQNEQDGVEVGATYECGVGRAKLRLLAVMESMILFREICSL